MQVCNSKLLVVHHYALCVAYSGWLCPIEQIQCCIYRKIDLFIFNYVGHFVYLGLALSWFRGCTNCCPPSRCARAHVLPVCLVFSSTRPCLWLSAVGSKLCWLRVHCFHVWHRSLLGRPWSLQSAAASFTEGLVCPFSPAGHIFTNPVVSRLLSPAPSIHVCIPCMERYRVALPHSPSHPSLSLAGTFKLLIEFSEEYPNKPPTVRFVSRMFHPNGKQTQSLSCEWWPSFPAEYCH